MTDTPNLAEMAHAFQSLQTQFNQALEQINNLNSALGQANQVNAQLQSRLTNTPEVASHPTNSTEQPKLRQSQHIKAEALSKAG